MSTIPCPACKEKVSTSAKECPHCGHPLTVGRSGFEGLKDLLGCAVQIMVVGFFILLIIGLIAS
tara:strand:- start:635 stop:826 length:192 start_codon:yes stop_codon:yes gene_type:complete